MSRCSTNRFASAIFHAAALGAPLLLSSAASAQLSLTTLFAMNGGTSFGGQMLFDLTVRHGVRITELDTNFFGNAGLPAGLEVYITSPSYIGRENNPAAWTLAARDDGTTVTAGLDRPTRVVLDRPIPLAPGSYGLALRAIGDRHARTNGTGSNEIYSDSNLTIVCGASQNAPWGSTFTPRVWNGTIYYNLAATTLFASNGGGLDGGQMLFDVDVSNPVRIAELDANFLAAAGNPVGIEIYTVPGTYIGNETNASAWTLAAISGGGALTAGRDLPTRLTLASPLVLPAGGHGVSIRALGSGHAYTNGNGTNQNHGDPNMALSFGAAQNVPWSVPFRPRVWNGRLHYEVICSSATSSSGVGCFDSGGSMSVLAHTGCADLSHRLRVAIHASATASGSGFLALGLSDTSWASIGLPLDLSSRGAPGCAVYVSHDALAGPLAFRNGIAEAVFPIPFDPALIGSPIHAQGYHGDPGANALGLVLSNYLTILIR